ncbi:MAG: ABC transporter permease [Firmicutes bacterium]|nr:ABC transporter permease [Bacillota bacterium]
MKKIHLRLLRMIKNTKGEFIAVIVLIVLGIGIYNTFSSTMVNLDESVKFYYNEMNFSDIFVEMERATPDDIKKLRTVNNIQYAEGRYVYNFPVDVEDEKVKVRLISYEEDENINRLFFREGFKIEDGSKECYVIESFFKARNMSIGDTLRISYNGEIEELIVKGVVSSPEYIYLIENATTLFPDYSKFGIVYVSEQFFIEKLGFDREYNELLVKLRDKKLIENIKDYLEDELDDTGIIRLYDYEDQLSNQVIQDEIEGNKKVSGVIPLIFLGIAAAIIWIMLSRIIDGDRFAIGIMKSLGYTNREILMNYLFYSMTIGLFGAIFGSILGAYLSSQLTKLYVENFFYIPMFKTVVMGKFIVASIFLSLFFTGGAGYLGSKKLFEVHPGEIMRPFVGTKGKRILLEYITFIWKRIKFSWKYILRSIFRNKRRFLFYTLSLGLTYGIILIPIFQVDQFDKMFINHYDEFLKMDYSVVMKNPVNEVNINTIKSLDGVTYVEPQIEYPFEIKYRWKTQVVNFLGLLPETKMYDIYDIYDDKIDLSKDGIYITESIHRMLEVDTGDTLNIKNFIPHRDDVELKVLGIVKQSLGSNCYMGIDYMREIFLDGEYTNGFVVNSSKDVRNQLEKYTNVESVKSIDDMKSVFMEFLDLSIASITVMLGFGGVLGFVIVYNTNIININERRLEFSSMRVMGFTKKEIFRVVIRENILVTFFGIAIGIPISNMMVIGIANAVSSELFVLNREIDTMIYVNSAFITIGFVIFALFFTRRKLKKLDFMQALKNRTT